MVLGRGYTITTGKFTILDSNVTVTCFHLVEIAFHSDMPATYKHASRT